MDTLEYPSTARFPTRSPRSYRPMRSLPCILRLRCAAALSDASHPSVSLRRPPTRSSPSCSAARRSWDSEMLSSSDSCVCYISVCPPCRAVATSPTCVAFPCFQRRRVRRPQSRAVATTRACPAPHWSNGTSERS